jgi:hypothetical protein
MRRREGKKGIYYEVQIRCKGIAKSLTFATRHEADAG